MPMTASAWEATLDDAGVLFAEVAHLARWRGDAEEPFMSREDWIMLQGKDSKIFDRMDASDGAFDARVSLAEFRSYLDSLRNEKGEEGEQEVLALFKSCRAQLQEGRLQRKEGTPRSSTKQILRADPNSRSRSTLGRVSPRGQSSVCPDCFNASHRRRADSIPVRHNSGTGREFFPLRAHS